MSLIEELMQLLDDFQVRRLQDSEQMSELCSNATAIYAERAGYEEE